MKTLNKKIILSMMLAILLAPAATSAGVYFIDRADSPAEGLELIKPCILEYPLQACADANKVPQDLCPGNNKYFKQCVCEEKYKWNSSNCSANQVLSGKTCDGKYENCECKAEFNKTCTGTNIGVGEACNGKYKSCCSDACASGYTKTKPGSGKCFDTAATACGTTCYKEKPCCDDSWSGQRCNSNQKCGGWDNCGKCNSCHPLGYISFNFAKPGTKNLRCEIYQEQAQYYPEYPYYIFGELVVSCVEYSSKVNPFEKELGYFTAVNLKGYATKEACESAINNKSFFIAKLIGNSYYSSGQECNPR